LHIKVQTVTDAAVTIDILHCY